jgi:hypothetical protein
VRGVINGTATANMGTAIEDAYCGDPDGRLRGCDSCSVTWFGSDDRCWVCGGVESGSVDVVSPTGSHSWSWRLCEATADDVETAAFVRRAIAGRMDPAR